MASTDITLSNSSKPVDKTPLKEQYVPFKERESQHVKAAPYIKNWLTVIALIVTGGVAGHLTGRWVEPKNIRLGRISKLLYGTDKLDRVSSTFLGIKIGAIYGMFHGWKKMERKRLGVHNISGDLKEMMNPEHVEKECGKQAAFINDVELLQEKLGLPKLSHSENITARREENRDSGLHI